MPVIGEGAARILGIDLDDVKSMRCLEEEMGKEFDSVMANEDVGGCMKNEN